MVQATTSPPASHASDPSSPSWRMQALLLGSATLAMALSVAAGVIDDAYISLRYAQRFAGGRGFSFNDGAPTEGFTNFLWTLLAAGAAAVGAAPMAVWLIAAITAALALTELTRRTARRLAGTPDRFDGWVGGGLVAASLAVAVYANSGLETVPYALLHTLAVVALADGRGAAFGVAASLAFMTRPEAGLTIALGLALITRRAAREPSSRPELARAVVALAVLALPFIVWKRLYFGASGVWSRPSARA